MSNRINLNVLSEDPSTGDFLVWVELDGYTVSVISGDEDGRIKQQDLTPNVAFLELLYEWPSHVTDTCKGVDALRAWLGSLS